MAHPSATASSAQPRGWEFGGAITQAHRECYALVNCIGRDAQLGGVG